MVQNDRKSYPPIHPDGIVDPNIAKDDSNVPFPIICPTDYETEDEFSNMYQYLQNGTLTVNVKKHKPILIMEDKYIIDEDGLLYTVDIPHQKNLVRLKPQPNVYVSHFISIMTW